MAITINGSGTVTGISAGGLPDAIITQPELAANVAGNGPAFSAYQSSAQTLSSATYTKLQFQSKEFDTNSNFDNATNYRFTPTVAGYYLVTACFVVATTATTIALQFYKNGSNFKWGYGNFATTSSNGIGSALIYCNGSTDYIEVYGYVGIGQALVANNASTYFQASMVRAA
jgi:hypothetical protein